MRGEEESATVFDAELAQKMEEPSLECRMEIVLQFFETEEVATDISALHARDKVKVR